MIAGLLGALLTLGAPESPAAPVSSPVPAQAASDLPAPVADEAGTFALFARLAGAYVVPRGDEVFGLGPESRFLEEVGPAELTTPAGDWTGSVEAGAILRPYFELGVSAQRYAFDSRVDLAGAPEVTQHQTVRVTSIVAALRVRTSEWNRLIGFAGLGLGRHIVDVTRRGYLETADAHATRHGLRAGLGGRVRLSEAFRFGLEFAFDRVDVPETHPLLPIGEPSDGTVFLLLPSLSVELGL